MAESKINRSNKKQLGQFMTPNILSKSIINNIEFKKTDKILEPSFGNGSFIIELIESFIKIYPDNISIKQKLDIILTKNLWGVEIDKELYDKCINLIIVKFDYIPNKHNLINSDFFNYYPYIYFNYIIGNPPFGGTISYHYQDELDKKYGFRNGYKIKKETYSFFIIKSMDMLVDNGKIVFICSDTFLTIKTMSGLRKYLFKYGFSKISSIDHFSNETNYPMLIFSYEKSINKNYIIVNNKKIDINLIKLTKNFSWGINIELSKYFKGELLENYIIASGGLSTGKNEYFIRKINNNQIIENYNFEYFNDKITLEKELKKAKLNKLGIKKIEKIKNQEKNGETIRNVKITKCEPFVVNLPNNNYDLYNKATNEILWSEPTHVIYWKDNGNAVLTYKKNGNWYLHGVGGSKFFKKEGLTWQLISEKINARYLPSGYILDNSSPIAILKDSINKDELYFILGWLLTSYATKILKNVINHTKNIQNKDIEKLPYPSWVKDKEKCINFIKKSIEYKKLNKRIINDFQGIIDEFYKL